MNDRTNVSPREEHRLSRRRMITASLGAVVGIAAVSKVASASFPNGLNGAAGPLQNSELDPAERITPPSTTSTTTTTTTTLPPVPNGQIMFPIDARPGDCWISDNFGDCRGTNCSRRHEGLDISGNRDADLFAVVTGRLTNKYVDRGLTYGAGHGWTLYDETTDITYKYFHMGTHAAGLEVGDVVEQGSVIGTVGNTGTSGANSDSNYHLHFEYRPGNVARDPRPLLVRHPNCTFYGD
jgi:murein DD-endopeptidase MepM/ murein hydrolase activator NlpD